MLNLIGEAWSIFIGVCSAIASPGVFAVAAPACLIVERSIKYYYLVNADYGSAEGRRAARASYLKVTIVMAAATALLFKWVFDAFEVRTKMLMFGASIWYFYTVILAYFFVRDLMGRRARGSKNP